MRLLVTGGAGFIGSNFIHYWLKNHPEDHIVNLDALTYAGHLESLQDIEGNPNYHFIKGDITNPEDVNGAIEGANVVVHFAAESHVDRSIMGPAVFVKTNVLGTQVLLDAAREAKVERFHHVSTDEVYGDLDFNDSPFTPETPYNPSSPYSASKAGSDHLVRAYFRTYDLPVTISNCANNYGPYQDLEKFLPRAITNLIRGEKIPLMGEGENVREWLHVDDHAEGIDIILKKGKAGETYLLQGEERTNKQVTLALLDIFGFDESMIERMEHRLGHDRRYANDGSKLRGLGWERKHNFDEELPKVVEWYKQNKTWWEPMLEGRPDIDPRSQKSYGPEKH